MVPHDFISKKLKKLQEAECLPLGPTVAAFFLYKFLFLKKSQVHDFILGTLVVAELLVILENAEKSTFIVRKSTMY